MEKVQLDIPFSTMLRVLLFLVAVFLVVKSVGILFVIYIAFILASALRPVVNFARFMRIPRPISILFIYLAVLSLVVTLIYLIIPPIVDEMTHFIRNLPPLVEQLISRYEWINQYIDKYELQDATKSLSSSMLSWVSGFSTDVLNNALNITSNVFETMISLFLVLTLTFYLLMGENNLQKGLASFFPAASKSSVLHYFNAVQLKLGSWLRSQLSLMFIVGILMYIGLTLLQIPYALPLAVIAGLLEVVPYIGPNVAAVIGFIVVLPTSGLMSLGVLLVAFIVQQLENYLIVPLVMKQAVGLDPIIVIISLAIGSQIFGLLGTVLAVPLVVTVQISLQFYRQIEREQENGNQFPPGNAVQAQVSLKSLLHRLGLHRNM